MACGRSSRSPRRTACPPPTRSIAAQFFARRLHRRTQPSMAPEMKVSSMGDMSWFIPGPMKGAKERAYKTIHIDE